MLIPSELGALLVAKVIGPDSASAFKQLGDTLSDYVKQKAIVNFSWAAVGPPPASAPDPIITATGKIINFDLKLTPAFTPDPISAFALMSLQFQVGWALATYNITLPTFTTTPGVVGVALPLIISIAAPDKITAMNLLASQFITWITSHTPLATVSGTNGIFTGAGTVASIT